MMFMMTTTNKSFINSILMDYMRSVICVQITQTILANDALLCFGGGAKDLFMG